MKNLSFSAICIVVGLMKSIFDLSIGWALLKTIMYWFSVLVSPFSLAGSNVSCDMQYIQLLPTEPLSQNRHFAENTFPDEFGNSTLSFSFNFTSIKVYIYVYLSKIHKIFITTINGIIGDFYNQAITIRETIGDKNGVALICNNLGVLYLEMKEHAKAIYYFNKSLNIARELDYKEQMKSNYFGLSQTYEALGDNEKALSFYKQYHDLFDSLFNEKNNEMVNEINARFDTERREKAFESLKKESDLKAIALDEQKRRNLFMGSALFLLVILAFVIFRNATKSKRANIILEKQKAELALQKKIVDEQHRDMLDSINYAQRIQIAVLPTQEEMQQLFPESFVFFRPRDIVSGDFWWIGQSGKIKIIAVADCTGHGVPGAFMSLIGNTALNEVVKEKHITDPGEILDRLAVNIVAALKQENKAIDPMDYSMGLVKDGMDIALCCIDEEKGELKFSGANNPIYYVSNGAIHEIKGDRQPVGIFTRELKPFTVHTLPLKEIESLYIFTDGYADQFGGDTGKKFKYSQLKQLLFDIHKKSPAEQEKQLELSFQAWRGNLDQVDDILVTGIKLVDKDNNQLSA